MKKIALFSLMCCLFGIGSSFGAGGCKLTTCTSGGDRGKYGNLLQATTGEVGWSFNDGQCYRCNWGDNDYECDEGTTFAVKHKDFWLTGQIKKFVKCSDEGEADDDWVNYNPTTTCNPETVKDDLKKLSEGLKRDYVIISGVEHSEPFYLLGGGNKTGAKQNTTGDNVILVTGNDGCVVYLCNKGYKASADRRMCIYGGQDDKQKPEPEPKPEPKPNPGGEGCLEIDGTTRVARGNKSVHQVCQVTALSDAGAEQCVCMCTDRGTWRCDVTSCKGDTHGRNYSWDENATNVSGGKGVCKEVKRGTTVTKSCRESRRTEVGKACCDLSKSEATYDAKNDKCNCAGGNEFKIVGGKGQCVETQVPEENCIYSFNVEIKCSTLTYKYERSVPLTKEQLGTHKCDEFNKLFATDANKYKELFGDPCNGDPEPTTTVPEKPRDTGPSEYAVNNAKKTLEAFAVRAEDERSVWRNAEGNFNTARLASDITAGVVLGTVGGVVTGVVIKKNQVKKGFEALHCTVGGQKVAEWGDEFSVGLRR